jgi:hypothetical protein
MFLFPLRRPREVQRHNKCQLADLSAYGVLHPHILTLSSEGLHKGLSTILYESDELAPPDVTMSVFEGKLKLSDVRT